MLFALVGEHVPSRQAKRQLDRRNKIQGDVILFCFLRDLFSISTQKNKYLGNKTYVDKMIFVLVGEHVPSPRAK